ncbi:GNAT family N-acetyltransferase [Diaminobutyricibacter tongyongensis]|uniref:GNAT family N-acetyltransferase n=1 Tax=Leifsonia tongyongensis TaxID=1268043 RepID=A0A6L9XZV5_9MICO|nr:GNAT family protein [Diaminobutyricibacter tongyongensis]NEN06953.1 GNAT family N-acetyltransferase [Diaminobutyricibacter tongyongensis]
MKGVTLSGDRVTLSMPDESDVELVTEYCRDPDVQRWTTVPSPYERTDALHFILDVVPAGWVTGSMATWAIRREPADELRGMIGLNGIAEGAAEIGYWLAAPSRGRGLMTAAVELVCDHAFAPAAQGGLGLRRIEWHAFTGNLPSAAVARGAGFRFEGTRRLGGVRRGERLDDWSAALLRDDPRAPAPGWPSETFA